jgi:hypothetical protein
VGRLKRSFVLYFVVMRCVPILLASMLLMGCNSSAPKSGTDQKAEERKSIAGSDESSQFRVSVELSENARKKLDASKETIVVAAYFTGRPKEGVEARYLDIKSGDIGLGNTEQEINPGQTAVFRELNLNTDAMSQIDSKGPQVLLNVVSGRRSSKNNLLGCTVYQGSLQSVRGETIHIRCKLIEEQ